MTPEEAADSLNQLAKLIAENIPTFTQEAALTAKALVQERIQEDGLSAELTAFPAYSPKYKKQKEKKQGSNAVAFRNLTLTGAMWRGTGIKKTGATSAGYEVVVGGINQDDQDKINWNSEQIGDILRVSDQEEERLREDYDAELDKLIAESGLG